MLDGREEAGELSIQIDPGTKTQSNAFISPNFRGHVGIMQLIWTDRQAGAASLSFYGTTIV